MQNLRLACSFETRVDKINVSNTHQLAILFLKVLESNRRKRFEHAAETAFQTFCTLRHAPHNTKVPRQKYNDAICFGKIVAFEDEALGFENWHRTTG